MPLRTLGIALILLVPTVGAVRAQQPPDAPASLILTGAKVFTGDATRPWAEAVAIRADRVVAVGTSAEIAKLAEPGTRIVDAGGRVVVPGFNDAHTHLGCVNSYLVLVPTTTDPFADPPFAALADSLRAAVARVPAGTWLLSPIGAAVLDDASARRTALDLIAPDHPVLLAAFTGHGYVLNSMALRALGIPDTAADPVGGRYEREPGSRRISGLLEEYAGYGVRRALCGRDPESTLVAALRTVGTELARLGVTSIQNMGSDLPPEQLVRVFAAARLPQRVRLVALPNTTPAGRMYAEWDALLAAGVAVVDGALAPITISGLKWILDGTPVERLAFHRAAYRDRPQHHGRLNFPPDTVRALLDEARERGQQPLLHAEGDSAISVLFGALESTGGAETWRPLRVRIEHGDAFPPDLRRRAAALGVIVVQNPTHFAAHPMWQQRFDAAFLATYQPMAALLADGVPLAIGSDGPLNPFLNLMMAITHPNNPREALSREQAVRAYTWGSAYAEMAEQEKGALRPGMLADLAILSQDIFEVPLPRLMETTSVLTVIGGRIVHDELGGANPAADGR